MQPLIAILLAIRAGIHDAQVGAPAYLWAVLLNREARYGLLVSGWKDIARTFVISICLDIIFQWVVFRWIYPGEALMIAFILAVVPYATIRGPVNRIVSITYLRRRRNKSKDDKNARRSRAA